MQKVITSQNLVNKYLLKVQWQKWYLYNIFAIMFGDYLGMERFLRTRDHRGLEQINVLWTWKDLYGPELTAMAACPGRHHGWQHLSIEGVIRQISSWRQVMVLWTLQHAPVDALTPVSLFVVQVWARRLLENQTRNWNLGRIKDQQRRWVENEYEKKIHYIHVLNSPKLIKQYIKR